MCAEPDSSSARAQVKLFLERRAAVKKVPKYSGRERERLSHLHSSCMFALSAARKNLIP